jgi:(p)ppGpp synthase/HD superfamily hydrolase
MSTLEDAISLAVQAHRGQVDKAGQPYILHPLRVMLGLDTEAERLAGVLHDVVEDTRDREPEGRITLATLRQLGFPEIVVEALDCLTRREGESYEDFIQRLKPNPLARRVKLADLTDNLDVRRLESIGERDLERLNRYIRARQALRAPA